MAECFELLQPGVANPGVVQEEKLEVGRALSGDSIPASPTGVLCRMSHCRRVSPLKCARPASVTRCWRATEFRAA